MSERTRFSGKVLLMAGVVFAALAGLVVFSGCEEETPTAQKQAPSMPMHGNHEGHNHASTPAPAAAAAMEQTTCPVMGGPINKAIFVDYQGKKVYFCCNGCPEAFKANPEKYLAKLPQFQK